jgi:hypothetical protein
MNFVQHRNIINAITVRDIQSVNISQPRNISNLQTVRNIQRINILLFIQRFIGHFNTMREL